MATETNKKLVHKLRSEYNKAKYENCQFSGHILNICDRLEQADKQIEEQNKENRWLKDQIISALCYLNNRKIQDATSVLQQTLKDK